MTDQQTIVQGRRTISRHPTAEIDKRREGRIDADGHRDKVWQGATIGQVVDGMNADLGKIADEDYWCEE